MTTNNYFNQGTYSPNSASRFFSEKLNYKEAGTFVTKINLWGK